MRMVVKMEHKCGCGEYANIIIFQRIGSMNYYTLLPNYYQGFNTPRTMLCAQQQLNVPPVLKILSQALKLSLSQFSAFYNSTAPQTGSKTAGLEVRRQLQRQVSIQNFKSEEKNLKTSDFKKGEIENMEQNVVILQVCREKHNQSSSQTNANDQVLLQNLLGQQHKENEDLSISNRKQNTRPKKHSFQVLVPQVDQIETVEAPALRMREEQLRKRRESLMLRQVESWDQKMKNRRDKREIRMLNK